MLIGRNWKIESDELNVILRKRYSKKTGGFGWRVKGYFSTIKSALRALIGFEVRETELKDLKTIEKKLDKIYKLMESLQLRSNPSESV